MNYEQKYKEALNKIKPLYEQAKRDGNPIWSTYEYLIPELRESEDEGIRKGLIDFVNHYRHNTDLTIEQAEWCKKALAYLEKQKVIDAIPDELIENYKLFYENGRREAAVLINAINSINEQKEQKSVQTAKEMWKEMRLEVYAQASGNRHEPNYSDDSTKMFSLCDIDEIFEKIGNSTVGSQPTEWSEEDGYMFSRIIYDVRARKDYYEDVGNEVCVEECEKEIDWLKNRLKSFFLQSKQEWSEEYEKRVVELKTFIAQCNGFNKANRQKAFNMIDALRPDSYKNRNSRWKPSKEQMAALAAAKIGIDTDYELLESLYEQLKAL